MRDFVAKRFAAAGPSVMASAAAEKNNYPDMIDLSIGDTDFTTDERIIRAAMADAKAGHTHYTDPQGDPELIGAIRQFYAAEYHMPLEKEQVFVTASSCFGMALALLTLLDPGDEVILFSPYFSPYKEQVELAGGTAVEVPTFEADSFGIDPARLEAAITQRTKALILNNPCNPTGAAYDMDTYRAIAAAAKMHDLVVLADEIYTDYMYETGFLPLRAHRKCRHGVDALRCVKHPLFIGRGVLVANFAAQPQRMQRRPLRHRGRRVHQVFVHPLHGGHNGGLGDDMPNAPAGHQIIF